MNFTREPIIETILSPKDGYKLCIKNSKIAGAEELCVDALEVVSFGQAFFFRSQERPRSFLVPVSDYEIFEVKETRVVLKNITHEKNIKINGGKESPPKVIKEVLPEKSEDMEKESEEKPAVALSVPAPTDSPVEIKTDKKRDRRRNRRKRMSDDKRDPQEKKSEESSEEEVVSEVKVSSAMFTHLLPPPPTLISETLGRLREKEAAENAPVPVSEESVIVSASVVDIPEIPKGEDFFG